MLKVGNFVLDFKRLGNLIINLKLADKKTYDRYIQTYPTNLTMSNLTDPETHLEPNKETTASNNNQNPSKKHKYSKEERKQDRKARLRLKQETKAVGFHDNHTLKQTEYYFENGLRKVYPYFFCWNTTAKERWLIKFFLTRIN